MPGMNNTRQRSRGGAPGTDVGSANHAKPGSTWEARKTPCSSTVPGGSQAEGGEDSACSIPNQPRLTRIETTDSSDRTGATTCAPGTSSRARSARYSAYTESNWPRTITGWEGG